MSTISSASTTILYWLSWTLIIFIYLTSIIVLIEVTKFVKVLNFHEGFWRCRQPKLNICYIIAFLFVLYILNPLTLFLYNIITVDSILPLFVNDVADILIFLLLFPRAWILWFDRAFFDNLKNWLWRRELNPLDANFLVRHRNALKSSHVIIYSAYLLVVAPLFSIVTILPYANVNPFLCDIIRTLVLLLLLGLTLNIVRQISLVFDEHSIRPELLGTVKTSGVAYVCAHIFYNITAFYVDRHWALLVELVFVCIADLFVLYYACRWARHKFEFTQKIRLIQQLKNNAKRSSFISLLSKRIDFQDIMDHRFGIESFCNHLQKEFGLESILFLLEVTQFKAVIRNISNGLIEDNVPKLCGWHSTEYKGQHHVFSAASILNVSWLPIDSRMFSNNPYLIAVHIYDKYIEESADLCINISFGIRKDIYRYFQELLQNQHTASLHDINIKIESNDKRNITNLDQDNPLVRMYKIYDSAFTEVWRLIKTDSYLRFKSTDDFRRLASVLFPEEALVANQSLVEMIHIEMEKERDGRRRAKKHGTRENLAKLDGYHTPLAYNADFTTVLTSISEEPLTQIITSNGEYGPSRTPISRDPITKKKRLHLGRSLSALTISSSQRESADLPMLEQTQRSCPAINNFSYNVKANRKMNKKMKRKKQHKTEVAIGNVLSLASLVNARSLPTPGHSESTQMTRVQSTSLTLDENDLRCYTP